MSEDGSPPPKVPGNNIIWGVVMGCGTQIVFILLGYVAAIAMRGAHGWVLALSSWGLTQWLVLIPLIRGRLSAGKQNAALGLILTGCLGLLLSSACAATFYGAKFGG